MLHDMRCRMTCDGAAMPPAFCSMPPACCRMQSELRGLLEVNDNVRILHMNGRGGQHTLRQLARCSQAQIGYHPWPLPSLSMLLGGDALGPSQHHARCCCRQAQQWPPGLLARQPTTPHCGNSNGAHSVALGGMQGGRAWQVHRLVAVVPAVHTGRHPHWQLRIP
jgi:hypothetical protein